MSTEKTSRLAILTLGQQTALRAWQQEHGRNWRSKLMDHFAAGGDANAPALRQIRNQHLPWLKSLTAADFELPTPVRYGQIPCAEDARSTLEGFGVEVGEYDSEGEAFHVRVSQAAGEALDQHEADFPTHRLVWADDRATLGPHGTKGMPAAVLAGMAAKVRYFIHTPEMSQSGQATDVNWYMDLLDELSATLRKHADEAPVFDNKQANSEGWCISKTHGSDYGPFQLQRLDEKATFTLDDDAWDFVARKATEGSAYHVGAIEYLRVHSRIEYDALAKATGYRVTATATPSLV